MRNAHAFNILCAVIDPFVQISIYYKNKCYQNYFIFIRTANYSFQITVQCLEHWTCFYKICFSRSLKIVFIHRNKRSDQWSLLISHLPNHLEQSLSILINAFTKNSYLYYSRYMKCIVFFKIWKNFFCFHIIRNSYQALISFVYISVTENRKRIYFYKID